MQDKKTSYWLIYDIIQYLKDFISYLLFRLRQVFFYSYAFFIWAGYTAGKLKQGIVKRMFWGRSNFYRSAFQFSVLFLTVLLGVGGLTGRLDLFVPQRRGALAYPAEQLGDSDYLNERGSIYSIVADSSLVRGFDVQSYVVQRGDTISSIAERFEVSEDTIRWENDITGDYLTVGQELKILPINGIIYKVKEGDSLENIADKYSANIQNIYDINWLESRNLKVGQTLLVPDGQKPQPKPIVIASTPTPAPAPNPAPTPIDTGGTVGTGSFVRPTKCGVVTNWFSAWHAGVDIAQSGGCDNVAIDTGTVTLARWYGRGGLQVVIDHGNGYESLYAHNSSLYVKEGQKVTKGQPIGYMGCTGSCTGTHIHFALKKNGVWVNPMAYIAI